VISYRCVYKPYNNQETTKQRVIVEKPMKRQNRIVETYLINPKEGRKRKKRKPDGTNRK